MMRPRRNPAPPTVQVPAVTVTPVEPAPIATPAAAPEPVVVLEGPGEIATEELQQHPAGEDPSTALVPYKAVTEPVATGSSVTIVRQGGTDAFFHPRPRSQPLEHRLRVHGRTVLIFVLLLVIGLARVPRLSNALVVTAQR